MKNKQIYSKEEKEVLLTFLKQTKKGKYAPIDKSALPYARIKEERLENYSDDEEFYYSYR